tara:strand:- start:56 stop:376 length:321 start_codon:yes stop_codon:yes gene_type:complete
MLIYLVIFAIGSALVMLFTKNSSGLPKPIMKKEKEMKKMSKTITKEKPVEKTGSESINLMQYENELVARVDELNALVHEVEIKLSQVRKNLETKGWVNSDSGWVIE